MRIILGISAVLCLAMVGCNKPGAPDCFKSAGDDSVEVRLQGVEVESLDIADLFVTEIYPTEDEPSVVILGPNNLIEEIDTNFENGELTIRNNSTCDWVRDLSIRMKVRIYTSSLNHINYNGTGGLSFADTLNTPYFRFDSDEGVQDAHLLLNSDSTEIVIQEGQCNVFLEGRAWKLSIFNRGLGKVLTSECESEVVLCHNAGPNLMEVRSYFYLYAKIASSGNIAYQGDPDVQLDVDPSATGQLIDL